MFKVEDEKEEEVEKDSKWKNEHENGLTSGWKSTIWTKRISQFDIYFKLS